MSETKRRSPEERLADIEKKMEQLKARKQQLQQRLSEKERKERTRRLIQIGAIFEKYFQPQSVEDAETLVQRLHQLAVKDNQPAVSEDSQNSVT